jgi:two-component system LytT family response regulator
MIRTLVVDDEPSARDRLRRLLRAFEDLEIVGEAADGPEAIEKIVELRPDVVLLDIQMPGCSGLDVVASLPDPRPRIIFCTAFDQYALDAFELNAVDYLLKPVNRARLAQAIDRIRAPKSVETDSAIDRSMPAIAGRRPRFLAKLANRYHVVDGDAVLYFWSDGGLTKLVTADSHYWMDPTLNALESRLDTTSFFRISRAAIVNLHAVREVVPFAGGAGEIVLKTGTTLEVSRRRFQELLQRLEG